MSVGAAAAARGAGADPPGRDRQGRGPGARRPRARAGRAPAARCSARATRSRPSATRRRKQVGEAIRAARARTGPRSPRLRAASTKAGERIDGHRRRARAVEAELEDLLLRIPNPADPDVPVGGEEANVTVRTWGEQLPRTQPLVGEVGADAPAGGATWERKPHWELGEDLGLFDLERGAKVAGSGFPVYTALGSRLQRALINWFLDVHTTENGFTEVWPPAVVNTARRAAPARSRTRKTRCTSSRATTCTWSRPPRSRSRTSTATRSSRRPTCPSATPPIRPCFRREAGAAGKDTRGILRVHQFDKVEMVLFEKPADSDAALEWMTERAEILLQRLGLAYRVLLMSTREMGFVQAKKYDLEVWAPGVERWLEVSSCSNFRDYQARRMAIRYRPGAGREARARPHAQRLGARAGARRRGAPRDVPAARRLGRGPGGHPRRRWAPTGSPRPPDPAGPSGRYETGRTITKRPSLSGYFFCGRFSGLKSSGSLPTGTSESGLRESPQMLLWRGHQTSSM